MYDLFPACAGVIPVPLHAAEQGSAFPRVCGGDPPTLDNIDRQVDFSPRVRG